MKRDMYFSSFFDSFYKKNPIILVDIGASGGIQRIWHKANKFLQVVGFEPDKRAFEKLVENTNEKEKFINAALHRFEGTVKFYCTKKQACSSTFEPNFSFLNQFPDANRYSIVETSDIPVRQLTKQILNENNIYDADFLKLDTQGCDLDILKGAAEIVDSFLFGVEVEVEFAPIYQNQPLFSDIDVFLRNHGFQLSDLRRYYWKRNSKYYCSNKKGQIVFADALYFKTYEAFSKQLSSLDNNSKKAKILKALSTCLVYNKVDYASYIADRANQDGIITSDEYKIILKGLTRFKNSISLKLKQSLIRFLKNFISRDNIYYVDDDFNID